jgi:hypothetical protein
VTSDKPIAVFAGNSIAYVPDDQTYAGNPLMQEQFPMESWWTNVVSLGFAGRTNGHTYRVLAAYSNTLVTITGTVVRITNEDPNNPPWQVTKTNETVSTNLMAGQFWDIIVDGPVWFQATKPIQVAQFANGGYFDQPNNSSERGDPCEILLPPAGHYLMADVVITPDTNTTDFTTNYLNLIVLQSATNSTYVDGTLVAASNFVSIATSGYFGAHVSVTNGVHTVTSSQPVGVEVYGWGFWDAYGYFGDVVR